VFKKNMTVDIESFIALKTESARYPVNCLRWKQVNRWNPCLMSQAEVTGSCRKIKKLMVIVMKYNWWWWTTLKFRLKKSPFVLFFFYCNLFFFCPFSYLVLSTSNEKWNWVKYKYPWHWCNIITKDQSILTNAFSK
jgi:hypothetical protein